MDMRIRLTNGYRPCEGKPARKQKNSPVSITRRIRKPVCWVWPTVGWVLLHRTKCCLMATVPRVLLAVSISVGQSHKCSLVAASGPLSIAIPETSTSSLRLSTSFHSSSSPLIRERKKTKGSRTGGVLVSATMADLAPSTVLVTGAGGRTGTPLFSFGF